MMSTAPALAACSPLPGAEQVWSRPMIRWVFVGELHGSNEAPAAFLDLVCDALARGRRVTVALERPTSEQPALDGILDGKDVDAHRSGVGPDEGHVEPVAALEGGLHVGHELQGGVIGH